jgi:hypothetical protein
MGEWGIALTSLTPSLEAGEMAKQTDRQTAWESKKI